MKKVLITGAAGFIGFHAVKSMVQKGYDVLGLDSLIFYYDVGLKLARLNETGIIPSTIRDHEIVQSVKYENYRFVKLNLTKREKIIALFNKEKFDIVIHLAAQPGVRESIKNPFMFIDSNINGLITILEGCRYTKVEHLVFASSSSVYGNNSKVPFTEDDNVDHPVSLYAATKKSGELMAYTYSHLYNIPVTALRFFTVYGPWGRPDMAYFKFIRSILDSEPIEVYNNGELFRDFTYIDDVIIGLINLLERKPGSTPPYQLFNIGNSSPVKLMDFIKILEKHIGKEAIKEFKPMQKGDVFKTFADVSSLENAIHYKPKTKLEDGLKSFVDWYLNYFRIDLNQKTD